jgi:hypothetical protein
MLGGIRSRLLGLVVATVVPFIALVGAGLWSQWNDDQAQALKSALDEPGCSRLRSTMRLETSKR